MAKTGDFRRTPQVEKHIRMKVDGDDCVLDSDRGSVIEVSFGELYVSHSPSKTKACFRPVGLLSVQDKFRAKALPAESVCTGGRSRDAPLNEPAVLRRSVGPVILSNTS